MLHSWSMQGAPGRLRIAPWLRLCQADSGPVLGLAVLWARGRAGA
jgi:hypothetical protein